MTKQQNRRDFCTLTAAALGGIMAGTGTAFGQEKAAKPKIMVDPALLLQEPHVCRGLNMCKNSGKGAKNACAGQGACATAEAHACAGMNECKGTGGCGGYPGQNSCKAAGHCAVPLKKEAWMIARKQFEHLMGDMKKKVGNAPK